MVKGNPELLPFIINLLFFKCTKLNRRALHSKGSVRNSYYTIMVGKHFKTHARIFRQLRKKRSLKWRSCGSFLVAGLQWMAVTYHSNALPVVLKYSKNIITSKYLIHSANGDDRFTLQICLG